MASTRSGTSSSSVTIMFARHVSLMASQKMSLEMTSSFFCSSPDSLLPPARPVRPVIGATATRLLIFLHAMAMLLTMIARSPLTRPAVSSRKRKVFRVSTPTR